VLANEQKYQKRKKAIYQGRTIYEWEQSLEEVHIWASPPPGAVAKDIVCVITTNHLQLGIKNSLPLYLDEDLGGQCVTKLSWWTFEDGQVHIQLQKMDLASVWPCALYGRATSSTGASLDAIEAQQVQQDLMKERFQQEHPGFDFSQAQFSGAAPDPRKFMGGLDYSKVGR